MDFEEYVRVMSTTEIASYYRYWGKAKRDIKRSGDNYHLLAYHSLDVAAVGMLLLAEEGEITKDIASYLEITPKQLQSMFVFTLALHDLGKFTSAFQNLYSNDDGHLFRALCTPYEGRDFRHDRLGEYFLTEPYEGNIYDALPAEFDSSLFEKLMECTLGHHGQPIKHSPPINYQEYAVPENLTAALAFVQDAYSLLQPDFPFEKFKSRESIKRLELTSWTLAGLAVLADWVGSDNTYFEYVSTPMPLADYWKLAKARAFIAVSSTDLLLNQQVNPYTSIKNTFGFKPTPLQHWAETVQIDTSPQLFILEDVTGSGKTEAALALTHRLLEAGAADGFYFGLPTMATSNAMFRRVSDHYLQMLSGHDGRKPSIVLAHGARDMDDRFREAKLASGSQDSDYSSSDNTATAQCNQWLGDSRKKALLAPVGVGTIDQALMAVLARRHQSLRLLGLYRKVLIFDEVHAADDFMFEILEGLLTLHHQQGGSAILLTATLSKIQRQRLSDIWLKAGQAEPKRLTNTAFPLATKVTAHDNTVIENELTSRADVSRTVAIGFLNTQQTCVELVVESVRQQRCIVWVCNTVADAQNAYSLVINALEVEGLYQPERVTLFHSRFVLHDRKGIETKVLNSLGKPSDKSHRQGQVLIATQVFQESLDADTDVMISDICPIDDLIQRAGRLHRHTRNTLGTYERDIKDSRPAPKLYVHSPEFTETPDSDWLSSDFQNSQYVYQSPGRLWLGLKVLKELSEIKMPENARTLIEAVYGEDAYQRMPDIFKPYEDKLTGEGRSVASKANEQIINWKRYGYCDQSHQRWHEDNSDISTRYSEIETVEVLLLKRGPSGVLQTWIEDGQFSIPLSTVKVGKNKYANKLVPIPERFQSNLEALEKRYPKIKYMQCWMPELDAQYAYDEKLGFHEKSPA
jgi:CRISPR-associated endonuclease/helicase Cas3